MDKDSYTGKEFFGMPEKHHHVSKLLVLCGALAIILIVSWLCLHLWNKDGDEKPVASAPLPTIKLILLTPEQAREKRAAIESMEKANTEPVKLSKKEIADKAAAIKAMEDANSGKSENL